MNTMPSRCQACPDPIVLEDVVAERAIYVGRQGAAKDPNPILALCPPCARRYREATDASPRRPDALLDGLTTFPPADQADPHGPKVLPERYNAWAQGRRAAGEPN